jgi:chromosome segregation ATPase
MSDTTFEAPPKWFGDAVLDIIQARDEIRDASAQVSRAMADFSSNVDRMLANDAMIIAELQGLRDEVRARLSNHDREIGDLRARVDKLERQSLIPGDELRDELREIRRRLDALEDDGK